MLNEKMHELSIAMSMIDMATEELKKNGGTKVDVIYMKLGRLSGVVKDALLFSWEVACQGTLWKVHDLRSKMFRLLFVAIIVVKTGRLRRLIKCFVPSASNQHPKFCKAKKC